MLLSIFSSAKLTTTSNMICLFLFHMLYISLKQTRDSGEKHKRKKKKKSVEGHGETKMFF